MGTHRPRYKGTASGPLHPLLSPRRVLTGVWTRAMIENMNSTVQIAKIDGPIPELEYDGSEGYVVERNGEWVGHAPTFDGAVEMASLEVGREIPFDEFNPDDAADYFGRQTWTARPAVERNAR